MDNISLLMGAGISLKAGMPTTKDITERVLYGINKNNTLVNYYTDESFYHSNTGNENLDNIYFRIFYTSREVSCVNKSKSRLHTLFPQLEELL